MAKILLEVRDNILIASTEGVITSDTISVPCSISFSDEWAPYGKTIFFYQNPRKMHRVVVAGQSADFEVPPQAIITGGELHIGVFGNYTDSEGKPQRKVAVATSVPAAKGSYNGTDLPKPSVSEYEQIISLMMAYMDAQELVEKAEEHENAAEGFANDAEHYANASEASASEAAQTLLEVMNSAEKTEQHKKAAEGFANDARGFADAADAAASRAAQTLADVEDSVEKANQYRDAAESFATEAAASATEAAQTLTDVKSAGENATNQIEKEKTDAIEEIKLVGNIVQTTGNSETAVMSQKATTDELDKLSEEIDDSFEIEIISKNRFNGVSEAGYLLEDGTLKQTSDWHTTDFIEIYGLESVVASAREMSMGSRTPINMWFVMTYDVNKKAIEYIPQLGSATYAPTENVHYIRFAYHADQCDKIMIEPGTVRSSTYQPYEHIRLIKDADYLRSGESNVKYNNLRESLAKAFTDGEYAEIDLTYEVVNQYIECGSGEINNYEGINHTGYLDCTGYEKLWVVGRSYASACVLAVFDEEKNCLATYPKIKGNADVDEKIVLPENAKYIIVSDLSAKNGIQTVFRNLIAYAPAVKPDTKKWEGKKWVCVGDSLTERNSRTTISYHDYVAEDTGIEVVNMGVSGSGYARKSESNKAFYQRIANVPTDADVVTIFGSGNDNGADLELGAPTDTGTETLCGCINTTIDNLIALMPTVSLGIVSPTPWVGQQPSNTNCKMALYSAALKTICEYRSIPFLDLYHCSNLRPWTEEGRAACYTKDDGNGVHPDETGHKLIAARFKSFLETLII